MREPQVIHGDCREAMAAMPAASFDACVTDPPYHLTAGKKGGTGPASASAETPYGRARITAGFMGKVWDGGDVAMQPATWEAVLRVLKPGAYLLAFGGTRTFHRMAVAIEDAGFEIRDCVMWLYGTGFPKSHDVSKGLDRKAGAEREVLAEGAPVKRMIPGADQDRTGSWVKDNGREFVPTVTAPATEAARQWQGWGTALKPAWEPVIVARKPLAGTVAENVLLHGAGALNIDGCRIATDDNLNGGAYAEAGGRRESPSLRAGSGMNQPGKTVGEAFEQPTGRWPANVIHDGSDEVLAAFPAAPGQLAKARTDGAAQGNNVYGALRHVTTSPEPRGDAGSAARFFYSAKAGKQDRAGSKHPTVKPIALMRYLCRLVTPPGGRILDPFAGSGTTGEAALREGFDPTLIEAEAEYVADIEKRLADWRASARQTQAEAAASQMVLL